MNHKPSFETFEKVLILLHLAFTFIEYARQSDDDLELNQIIFDRKAENQFSLILDCNSQAGVKCGDVLK